jgi:hypothetical protein
MVLNFHFILLGSHVFDKITNTWHGKSYFIYFNKAHFIKKKIIPAHKVHLQSPVSQSYLIQAV